MSYIVPLEMPKTCFECFFWNCPWYVKPFLFLFSPSIYDIEKITNTFVNGFLKGLNESIEKQFRIITEEDGE